MSSAPSWKHHSFHVNLAKHIVHPKKGRLTELKKSARKTWRNFVKHPVKTLRSPEVLDGSVFTFLFLISFGIMCWSLEYIDGQIWILGRMWSDFGAHIPLIRSFSHGWNFPPQYPSFPGEPIRYHYLFYLAAGLLERAGFNLAWALNIPSALGVLLLLWMIYVMTRDLFQSRKAALLALVLFLFNSTLTWWEIVKKAVSPLDFFIKLFTLREFASFGPWDGKYVSAFWNWNVYLNQRHLALSLGLVLLLVYPLIKTLLNRKTTWSWPWLLTIPLVLASFPLLHQAGFLMSLVWCSWLLCLTFLKLPKKVTFVYILGIWLSIVVWWVFMKHGGESVSYKLGFLTKEPLTWEGFSWYWWFNLGVYIPLIPLLIWKAPKRILLGLLPVVGFFVLANTFLLSADMINNHKLINMVMIGFNILTAGVFVIFSKKHKWLGKLIWLIFPFLILGGIADVWPVLSNSFIVVNDTPKSDVQQWIEANTDPKSIFLVNDYLYNPASIAGRYILLDYGYFAWSMGYNDGERRRLLPSIYTITGNKADVCEILVEQKVDYVMFLNPANDTEYDLEHSVIVLQFKPEWINNDKIYTVYNVKQNCITPGL